MSTLVESPLSVKDVDWTNQVHVGRGRPRPYSHLAAIAVAKELFLRGRWDGRDIIIIHDPYTAHATACQRPRALARGTHFDFTPTEAGQ